MKIYKWLKQIRVVLALLVLAGIFFLFADIYEWIPEGVFNSVLYLQFIPSLVHFLAVVSLASAAGFLIVLLLTFLTGRIYCSVLCPLGILQDVITRISRWRSKRKRFFKYKKAYPVLRYTFLGIMAAAFLFGWGAVASWLDPYSLAGRAFTNLLKPLVLGANNYIVVPVLQEFEVYSAYHQTLIQSSLLPLLLTLVVTGAIGYFAWKRGRLFCNTICPVGTLLGEAGRFSLLKVRFRRDRCTRCAKCAAVCKSECIDLRDLSVDHTRCVMCFNCLAACPESALTLGGVSRTVPVEKEVSTPVYSAGKGKADAFDGRRRKLIMTGLAFLTANRIYALKKNQMPESQKDLIRNQKDHPVAPPGAGSIARFNELCTACSLCVSACPTGVLQPALTEYGLSGFMQPHMDYLAHFCNYDCTKCGDVCPTGAILPLTPEEKRQTQMGQVVFVEQNCVVVTDGTDCGACSEHCPTKAVKMVPYKNGIRIPEVDPSICVGCGACEYACPVEAPFKAIYVNGNAVHQQAEKPQEEKEVTVPEEDFPF